MSWNLSYKPCQIDNVSNIYLEYLCGAHSKIIFSHLNMLQILYIFPQETSPPPPQKSYYSFFD